MQHITVQGQRFVDEQGRERIFHGINLKCDSASVREEPPFGRLALLDEEFFRRSETLGFGLLRLGINWEDIEPEKGRYNEVYLQKVDEIFDLAGKYGMYVFIDMHQDLYSSFGNGKGGGNGMPLWACAPDGYETKPAKKVWAEGYFWGKAVQRSFDHFWNNDPVLGKGLLEHFAEAWQTLARRYGDHPAFFGFDLLNEPYPGTPGGRVFRKLVGKLVRVLAVSPTVSRIEFLKNALCKETRGRALEVLSPAVMDKVTRAAWDLVRQFDLERYTPFVARMQGALREVTQNGVLMVEHCYYSNLGIPFSATLPEGESNACYTPHGYDFFVDTPLYKYASNARVGFIFEESRRAQQRLNVPVIVSEWGGGGEGEDFFPHIKFMMDLFDSFNWSNTYFAYRKEFYDKPLPRVISRPYPMAVNGVLEKFKVDTEAKTFTLWYTPGEADLPTEIYLPDGYESVDAGEGAEVTLEGHALRVCTRTGKLVVKYR